MKSLSLVIFLPTLAFAQLENEFQLCADAGYPTCQVSVGEEYAKGNSVPQDFAEAARWYRKAAEQGDDMGQNLLGDAYSSGDGVPQDSAQAAMWWGKSR